jgi:DNA-binding response OmpR family regulator
MASGTIGSVTHTLLVMDHNTTVQRVIKLAFQDEPMITVTTMARSDRNFEEIEADPPDIVLAENGREVAAFLKTRAALSHIPVVLLRGAFDPAAEGPDGLDGCADALMKPLQPQTMIDCVKHLLRTQEPRVPNVPSPPAVTHTIDSSLSLEQYFDQLNAAFSRTESMTRQPSDSTWLWERAGAISRGPLEPQEENSGTNALAEARNPSTPMVADTLTDEQLTQRVLHRLGDRAFRNSATEIVSRLSRWLLVDEVERSRP